MWNYDLKINLASNFNSGVILTPPSPETPSLLEFSVPPSVQSEVQRLVYRPLRLQSQNTPNAGRILDLDRGEHVECCESSERPWTGQFHGVVNLVNISGTAAHREHSPG